VDTHADEECVAADDLIRFTNGSLEPQTARTHGTGASVAFFRGLRCDDQKKVRT
jgi:hypothetical protein